MPTTTLSQALTYAERNLGDYIEQLRAYIRQPSVSARREGIDECAEFSKKLLEGAGAESRVEKIDGGFPIVYGTMKSRIPGAKTLLVYGHYDVQPPDPLEEWKYPPFGGELIEGKIYGRGAVDDKGPLLAHIKAAESYLKATGDVPVSLIFVLEGEEEIGSPNFHKFVKLHLAELRDADAAITFDGLQRGDGTPEIYTGLKGLLYVELTSAGLERDLHSMYGPIVEEPAWRLILALGALKDAEGRILIEGFYDKVRKPDTHDFEYMKKVPLNEKEFAKELGVKKFSGGMHGTDILNALCFEPTCTISGLLTGYVGPGVKTVLPAKAVAKVSFRLPPDMSPEDTLEKLKKHMRTHGFDDIDVKSIGHMYALRCSVDDPIVQVTVESAREIFGTRTVLFPVCPASAHACYFIADRGWAGLPLVCTGVGYMQLEHSPNEYITTEQFRKGIEYSATIMQKFAQT